MDCIKVNFCAAPSSGKSTVCSGLESRLKQAGINADTSKEYSRQFIQQYGVPRDLASEFIIYDNQFARDKGIAEVSDVILSDAPAMNCYLFGKRSLNARMYMEGRSEPSKEEYKLLEELHKRAVKRLNWYDIIFVFPPLEAIQDGTRIETNSDVLAIYNATKGFLDVEGNRYVMVEGTVEQKIQQCFDVILAEIG